MNFLIISIGKPLYTMLLAGVINLDRLSYQATVGSLSDDLVVQGSS
jgi:hypothetical protein